MLTATASIPSWFVVIMGLAIVFVGLILIIYLCKLMNLIYDKVTLNKKADAALQTASAATATEIPNRREMIAAISAAIAEENGTDISAIRILSVKKL